MCSIVWDESRHYTRVIVTHEDKYKSDHKEKYKRDLVVLYINWYTDSPVAFWYIRMFKAIGTGSREFETRPGLLKNC